MLNRRPAAGLRAAPHKPLDGRRQPRQLRTRAEPETDQDPHSLRHAEPAHREFVNLLQVRNAEQFLQKMPAPGWTLHGVVAGDFAFGDIIPAVLRLIAPAHIEYLAITTLGFSQRAASNLLRMIDAGHVGRLDFIAADFFEKADAAICAQFRHALRTRAGRFAAARVHAKVWLIGTSAGDRYTIESSANVRACKSVEQFALTNSPEFYEFHRAWVAEILDAYAPPEARKERTGQG